MLVTPDAFAVIGDLAEASLAGPTERVHALMRAQGAQEQETWGANTAAREHPLSVPPKLRRRAMAEQLVRQYEKCAFSACVHGSERGDAAHTFRRSEKFFNSANK